MTFRNSIVQSTVGLLSMNAHKDEEATFIGQKSGKTS